jgi:hypothetical protein
MEEVQNLDVVFEHLQQGHGLRARTLRRRGAWRQGEEQGRHGQARVALLGGGGEPVDGDSGVERAAQRLRLEAQRGAGIFNYQALGG